MNARTSARFQAVCCCASTEVMAARSASESWAPALRLTACGVRSIIDTPRITSAIKTLEFIELPLVSRAERYRKRSDAATDDGAAALVRHPLEWLLGWYQGAIGPSRGKPHTPRGG